MHDDVWINHIYTCSHVRFITQGIKKVVKQMIMFVVKCWLFVDVSF